MTKKVLVAEDHDDNRQMMKMFLEMYGYRVIEASDGGEAVEKAILEHPDLILMDLGMPELDGVEATKAIKTHQVLADVPVVAISGYHDAYGELARQAGCLAVFHKPLDFTLLKPLVSDFIH